MSSGDESSTSQTIPRPARSRGRPKKRPRPPSRKKQSQPTVTIESVDISSMDISMDSTPLIASSPYAEASAEDNDSTPMSTPVKRKPGRPRREQIKRRKKENGRIDRKGIMEEGMDEDEEVERKNSEEGFKENIVLGENRGREKEKNREKGKIEKDKDGNRDNNATVDSNKRAELTDKNTDKTTEGSVATKDTEDEKGEQKITRDGLLLGGRHFKVPVFQLPTRGSTWYMMAMEPAKLLGFRDSYLFFLRNPSLKRIYATEQEREYLIDRNILSSNFRNRQIALVSARSTFKVFGYKIIKGGKRRRDDYYEAEVPDGYDDDPSDYDVSESTIPGGNGIKRNTNSLASSKAHAVLDETNWMYQSALAIREFNTQLRLHRRDNPKYYDPHTNFEHVPQATQPTRMRIEWASEPQKYPSFDVRVEDRQPEITFVDRETNTLGDLDEEVLEVLPQDIKDIVTEMRERAESKEAHGWEMYPLALMDGQYQSTFSIHQLRFNRSSPNTEGAPSHSYPAYNVPYTWGSEKVFAHADFT